MKLNKKGNSFTSINKNYYCRVCGLYSDPPPWGENGDFASFDMCGCCGVEHGYEDCTREYIRKYRNEWLGNGAKWMCPEEKPENWSLEKQLKNIPEEFYEV